MDWIGGGAPAVREVVGRARALALTAFQADPRVAQVVLTGQYHVRGPFDGRRNDATFTARLQRDLLLVEPPDLRADLALSQAGDVWYSPALTAGALVVHRPRPHEARRVAALAGDRSVESAEHFDGNLLQRIAETKHRLDGILFGLEGDGRLWRGNPRRREVALTFDDGPNPVATPLLLAILRRFGAHATFFVVGEHSLAYPYLIRQMATEGHEVANHTFHHPRLTTLDAQTIREELTATTDTIRPAAGPPRWFRPPGGDYSPQVAGIAREAGLSLAMWTVNSGDWGAPSPTLLAERVLGRAEPGAIILLHNGTLATVRALPQIIAELQRRGYDLVTVSALARGTE
jgi:peptidoglycan/xylan/chitin deacetylase (PgdA/CDA1 family)